MSFAPDRESLVIEAVAGLIALGQIRDESPQATAELIVGAMWPGIEKAGAEIARLRSVG